MEWRALPTLRWGAITGLTLIVFLMERGEKIMKTHFPNVTSLEIYGWAIVMASSIGLGKFFAEKISEKITKRIEAIKQKNKGEK